MSSFVSPSAAVKGVIADHVLIFGPSTVSEGTFIGPYCVLGFPVRKKLVELIKKTIKASSLSIDFEAFDVNNEGVKIGFDCIIRNNTTIYERVEIEDKVETGHQVFIREDTKIGSETRIGTGTIIDGNVTIGRNCNIQSMAYLPPKTVLRDNVFIGPCMTVTNDKYPFSGVLEGVTIEDEAIIGAGTILISGVTVGKRAVIGAGAVVVKDVPPDMVFGGLPAKKMTTRALYDEKQLKYRKKI
ncbi:MAG: acyltransferase [Candidatus Wukongarchaeota archaeon]|nr:DapH/DapD/GlmU-related protein [Candidatus Wukongarchaeota archaeon]